MWVVAVARVLAADPAADLPGWGQFLVVYGPLGLIAIAAAWFVRRTIERSDALYDAVVKDRDGWAAAYVALEQETRASVVPLVPNMTRALDKASESQENALKLMANFSARLDAESRKP